LEEFNKGSKDKNSKIKFINEAGNLDKYITYLEDLRDIVIPAIDKLNSRYLKIFKFNDFRQIKGCHK